MVGRPGRLRVQRPRLEDGRDRRRRLLVPVHVAGRLRGRVLRDRRQVTKRIWAPLGEKDYSSYISQIPDDVDGLYVGIGGSGSISFIKQYEQQKGRVDTEKMMGNVFWDDPLVLKEVGKSLVGGATAAMTAGDADTPEVKQYIENLKTSYGDEIAGAARRCSRTATTPG